MNSALCELCQRPFQYRGGKFSDNEPRPHCARCSKVLLREKKLKEKLLDVEWMLYGLEFTNYFDD